MSRKTTVTRTEENKMNTETELKKVCREPGGGRAFEELWSEYRTSFDGVDPAKKIEKLRSLIPLKMNPTQMLLMMLPIITSKP